MGMAMAPTIRSAAARLINSRLVRMRLSLGLLRKTAMESKLPAMVMPATTPYITFHGTMLMSAMLVSQSLFLEFVGTFCELKQERFELV